MAEARGWARYGGARPNLSILDHLVFYLRSTHTKNALSTKVHFGFRVNFGLRVNFGFRVNFGLGAEARGRARYGGARPSRTQVTSSYRNTYNL